MFSLAPLSQLPVGRRIALTMEKQLKQKSVLHFVI